MPSKKFIASVGIVCVLSILSTPAQAVLITHSTQGTLFSDHGESQVVGDRPDTAHISPGPGVWDTNVGGNGTPVTQDTSTGDLATAATGSKYFALERTGTSAGSSATMGANWGTGLSTGVVTVEFALNIQSGMLTNGFTFYLDAATDTTYYPPRSGYGYKIHAHENGNVEYQDPSGWVDTGLDWTADQWENWTVEADLDNDVYNITVGSNTATGLAAREAGLNIQRATFFTNTMTDGKKFYLDSSQEFIRFPGDANSDGVVDEEDAALLAANWLQSEASWGMGDFNEDGKVDDKDATIMAANWQTGLGATVPEPGMIIMLASGIVLLICRRRK